MSDINLVEPKPSVEAASDAVISKTKVESESLNKDNQPQIKSVNSATSEAQNHPSQGKANSLSAGGDESTSPITGDADRTDNGNGVPPADAANQDNQNKGEHARDNRNQRRGTGRRRRGAGLGRRVNSQQQYRAAAAAASNAGEHQDDDWYQEDGADHYRFQTERQIQMQGSEFRVTVVNNKCIVPLKEAPVNPDKPVDSTVDQNDHPANVDEAQPPVDVAELVAKRRRNRIRRFAAPQFRRVFIHGIRINRMLHQVSRSGEPNSSRQRNFVELATYFAPNRSTSSGQGREPTSEKLVNQRRTRRSNYRLHRRRIVSDTHTETEWETDTGLVGQPPISQADRPLRGHGRQYFSAHQRGYYRRGGGGYYGAGVQTQQFYPHAMIPQYVRDGATFYRGGFVQRRSGRGRRGWRRGGRASNENRNTASNDAQESGHTNEHNDGLVEHELNGQQVFDGISADQMATPVLASNANASSSQQDKVAVPTTNNNKNSSEQVPVPENIK